jgi:thiol-disulfide isomerase/thioredoxin
MTGLYVAVATLMVASTAGLLWRRRNGVLRAAAARSAGVGWSGKTRVGWSGKTRRSVGAAGEKRVLAAAEIGGDLGEKATLVQFSSAFCAPCRATRQILKDVAGMIDGVTHVEIDAESHLDLVRRLGIFRTPTVLILDPSGTVVRRASGLPRKTDVLAALADGDGARG